MLHLSRKIVVQAVQVALQKPSIHGQNLRKLVTLITIVKSVVRQFKPNLHQAVQVLPMQLFIHGQNCNEMSDELLAQIENLKWLPWIGSRFNSLSSNDRLLIVGESHYHDKTSASIEKHNSPTFTREIIEELAVERWYYGTKIFPNLHRALFRNDDFNSSTFWSLVSFYNFVQRPMDTNKGRPSYEDFYNGWFPFLEIVKLLKPKTCLFIGTSAANSLAHAVQNTDFSVDEVKWEDYISNAYAKTARIKDNEENETQLIFIRHTSQMFSWSKWNDYLQKKIPSELNWLSEQLTKK